MIQPPWMILLQFSQNSACITTFKADSWDGPGSETTPIRISYKHGTSPLLRDYTEKNNTEILPGLAHYPYFLWHPIKFYHHQTRESNLENKTPALPRGDVGDFWLFKGLWLLSIVDRLDMLWVTAGGKIIKRG